MIESGKQENALTAINVVLVLARHLAHQGKTADVVQVLDTAEYLPRLMLDSEDRTQVFRAQLAGLAEAWPGFSLALERFDSSP